jgi:hypothetical protein
MDIPSAASVRKRVGPDAAIRPASHWVTGRQGLTWFVERPDGRSVFKWVDERELLIYRDLLPPGGAIRVPRLLRTWSVVDAEPAAVEMELIPHLAAPRPCYRFTPDLVPLADPAWTGERLDSLIALLADKHACHMHGSALEPHAAVFDQATPQSDRADWQQSLAKLVTIADRSPAGRDWHRFWCDQESLLKQVSDELYEQPLTWIWGDAKWDHIGCRADGEVVVLEWSTTLGPAGSDLFLLLFLPPARRDALLHRYCTALAPAFPDYASARRATLLGLLRACFIHGPGQSTLSLRGVAAGSSTPADLAAWAIDARTTASAIKHLRDEVNL